MSRDILEVLGDQLRRNFFDSTKMGDIGPASTVSISNTSLALDTRALLKPMDYEPIYGRLSVIGFEALGRPHSNGTHFQIQEIADQLFALGHEEALDKISIVNALIGANRYGCYPVTINISLKSALSENFWLDMVELLHDQNPSNIIFEILEHPVQDTNASVAHLHDLKKMGYRFALDDIREGQEHEKRLKLLGDVVDFVKIEGRYIRRKLTEDPQGLKAFIADIKVQHPQAEFIAEHVQNFVSAQKLFEMGFSGVQGKNLSPQAYIEFLHRAETASAETHNLDLPLN